MMLRTWRQWTWDRRVKCRKVSASSRFRPRFEQLEGRDLPAAMIFVVNNTNSDGEGSFRQAIIDANRNPNDPFGPDIIQFNIDSGAPSIAPLKALDAITEAVVIDGTTQPGFAGSPQVELNGALAGDGTHGLVIAASGVEVRGLVINRFGGDGIRILGSNNLIEGNFIGTDRTGLLDRGNGGNGVTIASTNSIGGPAGNVIANNLISGNGGNGVAISNNILRGGGGEVEVVGDLLRGNEVRANLIGVNAAGEVLGNRQNGVSVTGSFNVIGGVAEGNNGNFIAFNALDGVSITGSGIGNTILSNAIFENGGLGINLDKDGVTPNDLGDDDFGPNGLYNFPELKSYDLETGVLTVVVSGSPTSEGAVLLQFFISTSGDANGHGEGRIFVSELVVGVPPTTSLVVEVNIGSLPGGSFITATGTEFRTGSTSEFSNALRVPRSTGGEDPGGEDPGGEEPTPKPIGQPRPLGDGPTDEDRNISIELTPPPELSFQGNSIAGLLSAAKYVLQLPVAERAQLQLQELAETGRGGGSGSELRDAISRAYTGEIGGMLFNDLNGDGHLDPGELPLSSHIVYLDANDNGKLDDDEWWTVTSKKGEYRFPHLPPGRYNVRPLTDTQSSQALQAKGYEVKRIAPMRTTVPEVGRRQVELTDSQRTVYDVNFGARVRVRQNAYVPVRHGPDESGYPDVRSKPPVDTNSPAEEATLPEKSPGEMTETAPPR